MEKAEESRSQRQTLSSFLTTLSLIVEQKSTDHIIHWDSTGTIIVIESAELMESILGNYFKHANFSSFVRQFNLYGFHKIKSAGEFSSDMHFVHEHFNFHQPELKYQIKRNRKRPVTTAAKSTTSSRRSKSVDFQSEQPTAAKTSGVQHRRSQSEIEEAASTVASLLRSTMAAAASAALKDEFPWMRPSIVGATARQSSTSNSSSSAAAKAASQLFTASDLASSVHSTRHQQQQHNQQPHATLDTKVSGPVFSSFSMKRKGMSASPSSQVHLPSKVHSEPTHESQPSSFSPPTTFKSPSSFFASPEPAPTIELPVSKRLKMTSAAEALAHIANGNRVSQNAPRQFISAGAPTTDVTIAETVASLESSMTSLSTSTKI